jgi:hypothetical protein
MPVLFSSATDEWPTPQAFFDKLNRRYRFTLDPCATPENATAANFMRLWPIPRRHTLSALHA